MAIAATRHWRQSIFAEKYLLNKYTTTHNAQVFRQNIKKPLHETYENKCWIQKTDYNIGLVKDAFTKVARVDVAIWI